MPFFDNLGKKVGEAAQAAAKKSSELVETTKLNMSINTAEDKINKIYLKIGENIFAKYNAGQEIDPDFIDDCKQVKELKEEIDELKAKIMELKNVKLCTSCGAELNKDVMFCPKCGAKQEQPAPTKEEEASKNVFCKNCGASIPEGSAFCQSCGAKVE